MRSAAKAALALLLALAAPGARAEPHRIDYDLRTDAAIVAAGWGLYGGAWLARDAIAPASCRICGTNALDAGARDLLVWSDGAGARRVSDVLAFALVPAGVVAHQLLAARAEGDVEAGLVDALVVAEAASVAMALNQVVKFAVGRQRPSAHHGTFGDAAGNPDRDDNLSFFSAHSTVTFALAAAAGTVSDLRGYRSAPFVWGAGMALAATTAWLRVAADRHWLTDVLAGAAVGTAAGIALPRLLHGREDGSRDAAARLTVVPLGMVLVF